MLSLKTVWWDAASLSLSHLRPRPPKGHRAESGEGVEKSRTRGRPGPAEVGWRPVPSGKPDAPTKRTAAKAVHVRKPEVPSRLIDGRCRTVSGWRPFPSPRANPAWTSRQQPRPERCKIPPLPPATWECLQERRRSPHSGWNEPSLGRFLRRGKRGLSIETEGAGQGTAADADLDAGGFGWPAPLNRIHMLG